VGCRAEDEKTNPARRSRERKAPEKNLKEAAGPPTRKEKNTLPRFSAQKKLDLAGKTCKWLARSCLRETNLKDGTAKKKSMRGYCFNAREKVSVELTITQVPR